MAGVFQRFWLTYALVEPRGDGRPFRGAKTLSRILLAWSIFTALSRSPCDLNSLLTCQLMFGRRRGRRVPQHVRAVQSRGSPIRPGRIADYFDYLPLGRRAVRTTIPDADAGSTPPPSAISSRSSLLKPLPTFAALAAGFLGLRSRRAGLGRLVSSLVPPTTRGKKRGVNEAELAPSRAGRLRSHLPAPAADGRPRGEAMFSSPAISGHRAGVQCACRSAGLLRELDAPVHDQRPHPGTWIGQVASTRCRFWFQSARNVFVVGLLTTALLNATGRTRFSRALFPLLRLRHPPPVAMAFIPFAPPCLSVWRFMSAVIRNDIGQAGECRVISSAGASPAPRSGLSHGGQRRREFASADHGKRCSRSSAAAVFILYWVGLLTAQSSVCSSKPTRRFYETSSTHHLSR